MGTNKKTNVGGLRRRTQTTNFFRRLPPERNIWRPSPLGSIFIRRPSPQRNIFRRLPPDLHTPYIRRYRRRRRQRDFLKRDGYTGFFLQWRRRQRDVLGN